MKPIEPIPVKLFCGILYREKSILQKAVKLLTDRFGNVDYNSSSFLFDVTDYYVQEMGEMIFRIFYSFENLINPAQLVQIKLECKEIEDKYAIAGKRKVNLDPGYMDYDKIVLASFKYNAQKVYLNKGIYADVTMYYRKGRFIPSEWCFPDFKNGIYEKDFLKIRALYKKQIR